jgi:hypothetical protein
VTPIGQQNPRVLLKLSVLREKQAKNTDFFFKNSILYETQLLDELVHVVGSFKPPDARAACDGICRHFAYGSYLLKVW